MDRKRSLAVVAAVAVSLALSGCTTGGDAPSDEPRRYDAEAFFSTISLSGSSFSADETRILVSSDETGVFNVYSQPVAGGERTALTSTEDESSFGVSWFPRDDRFLYTADRGGNELFHLYVSDEGTVTDLTPGENLRAQFVDWSGDDEFFYVATNERDPQASDLYRYRTSDYERELVFRNENLFEIRSISSSGRWLSLDKLRHNADTDVYLADLESGEVVHVTPHEGDVVYTAETFDPEEERLFYSTNGEGEFSEVWSYALSTGEHRPEVAADWDVSRFAFSKSGRYTISATNVDAATEVSIVDGESGSELDLSDLPVGNVGGVRFSPSERYLALYVNSDTSPADLYVYDLETGDQVERLTHSLGPAMRESDLVESQVIRYASFDGLEIPAILWRPHGASGENPAPALVWVHGGPGGQTRRGYSMEIQHLVNQGYAVLGVNNRGSSGYGKTFFHLDDRRHGDVDLKDCVAARSYLESLDFVDSDRIGIIGGSYGGYMVAAALAFEPEVFDVGIDIFGVTNWLRTLESIPAWWGPTREALYAEMGDPSQDAERLRRISPLFHADNIVKPMLVVQGANDPRVLQVESDELVAAARAGGTEVEYVLFDDEGHGFTKRENRVEAARAFETFLESHL